MVDLSNQSGRSVAGRGDRLVEQSGIFNERPPAPDPFPYVAYFAPNGRCEIGAIRENGSASTSSTLSENASQ